MSDKKDVSDNEDNVW